MASRGAFPSSEIRFSSCRFGYVTRVVSVWGSGRGRRAGFREPALGRASAVVAVVVGPAR